MELGFVQGFGTNYTDKDIRSYIQKRLEETPQTDSGQVHTVKKGENLWSIAKKYLGKAKPTNGEIQDFMYKIAKLNNKETLEDFNNLDINDTLYIPAEFNDKEKSVSDLSGLSNYEKVQNAAKELQKMTAPEETDKTYSSKIITKYNKLKLVPDKAFEAHGHAGFNNWTDELKGNKDLKIEKSYSLSVVKPSALVFRKKTKDNVTEASLYAAMNPDGSINRIAFEAPGFDVKGPSFDYIVDSKGNLMVADPSHFSVYKVIGKISQDEYKAMLDALEPRMKEYLARQSRY